MRLSSEVHLAVARKAQVFLDVNLGRFGNDTVVFAGDGVDDLDRMLAILGAAQTQPGFRMLIDLGTQYSAYHPCDLEDLAAIREALIQVHGNVNKPDAYRLPRSKALEVSTLA